MIVPVIVPPAGLGGSPTISGLGVNIANRAIAVRVPHRVDQPPQQSHARAPRPTQTRQSAIPVWEANRIQVRSGDSPRRQRKRVIVGAIRNGPIPAGCATPSSPRRITRRRAFTDRREQAGDGSTSVLLLDRMNPKAAFTHDRCREARSSCCGTADSRVPNRRRSLPFEFDRRLPGPASNDMDYRRGSSRVLLRDPAKPSRPH